jgi:hypothetical protein
MNRRVLTASVITAVLPEAFFFAGGWISGSK